jgi:hypothetical protein
MLALLNRNVIKTQLKFVTFFKSWAEFSGAGKTTLTFSISVNILSANFPFCVIPAGGEGGKYVDVSGKC